MARKARPNTAIIELKVRVPKGVTAAQARRLVTNGVGLDIYLDPYEEEVMGVGEVKFRVGKARIERPVVR
jgi:hypothetical protein